VVPISIQRALKKKGGEIMSKLSKKLMLSTISSLSLVAFVVGASTFSWFQLSESFNDIIVVDSGDLDFSSYDVSLYKYIYPDFNGDISYDIDDDFINYDGEGEVHEFDKETILSTQIPMNKYDPFFLVLNTEDSVSDLMTNIVMEFTAEIENTVDAELNFNVIKIDDVDDSNLRITDYLDFWLVTESNYNSSSATYEGVEYTDSPYLEFYKVKNYAEVEDSNGDLSLTPTFSFIGQDDSVTSGTLYTQQIPSGAPAVSGGDVTVTTVHFFINFDYNQDSLSDFLDTLEAGVTQYLYSDYYFSLSLEQI